MNTKLENIPNIVMSSCVLHNFRLIHEDQYTIEIDDTDIDFDDMMKTVPSSQTSQ